MQFYCEQIIIKEIKCAIIWHFPTHLFYFRLRIKKIAQNGLVARWNESAMKWVGNLGVSIKLQNAVVLQAKIATKTRPRQMIEIHSNASVELAKRDTGRESLSIIDVHPSYVFLLSPYNTALIQPRHVHL